MRLQHYFHAYINKLVDGTKLSDIITSNSSNDWFFSDSKTDDRKKSEIDISI